jgi:hypothetical protein
LKPVEVAGMSARTSVQVDAKQPDGSSAGEGAPLKAASSWRSLEIETLCCRWRAAARPPLNLPPFEELALDGLGNLADSVALLQIDDAGELNILRAGKVFEAWIDRPAHKLKVAELSIERARALRDLYAQAVTEAQPVQAVAHGIINGSVCVYDLVALPLFNHFGPPLFLVYMQERERKFSLIEAMFQATTEGLVALAVVRDAAGAPIDFEIAALNEVAALVMQGTAEGLRGRHLSEVCDEIQASQMLPRLVSVFNGGGSAHFELECPLDDQKHLRVGVVTMGDLLAVTLTDYQRPDSPTKVVQIAFRGQSGSDVALRPREHEIFSRERRGDCALRL